MSSHTGNGCESRCDSEASFEAQVVNRCCFGVEPRTDGSVMVVAQEGEAATIRHFRPEQAATVVQFVREKSRSPRVCVASTGGHALRLALAFGELPQAEVILLRPAALPHRPEAANSEEQTEVALALARYARRAA
jgi:hypothetical protein